MQLHVARQGAVLRAIDVEVEQMAEEARLVQLTPEQLRVLNITGSFLSP